MIDTYLFNKVEIKEDFGKAVYHNGVVKRKRARDVVAVVCAGGHTCDNVEYPSGTVKGEKQSPDVTNRAFNAGSLATKEQ